MPGILRHGETVAQDTHADGLTSRPSKRARTCPEEDQPGHRSLPPVRPPAQPLGNLLLRERPYNSRNPGLGRLAVLPDEIIASIFSELRAPDLVRSQGVSRAFFAFSRIEGHWKLEYIKRSKGSLEKWRGSWRSTYLYNYNTAHKHPYPSPSSSAHALPNQSHSCPPASDPIHSLPTDEIRIRDLYSDVLYLPHLAARYDAKELTRSSNFSDNVLRVDGSRLSPSDLRDTPMILRNLMQDWGALQTWSLASLAQAYPETKFRAEAVLTHMEDYLAYHDACGADESPLYIFDADFVEKTKTQEEGAASHGSRGAGGGGAGGNGDGDGDGGGNDKAKAGLDRDFNVPSIFRDDLFKVMGDERPNYRWLIAGPERSGSTFHCDPNGTSAWNAVVTGRKLWILFPPDVVPPGILVSEDQSEVEAPLSLAEWLMNYYHQAKATYGPRAKEPQLRNKMQEGVCERGEVFYVPAGWWHLVVNLESSIAVTQNFVSPSNLGGVLYFLKYRSDQVSGFKIKETSPTATTMTSSATDQTVLVSGDDAGQGDYRGEDEDETGVGQVYHKFLNSLRACFPDVAEQGLLDLQRIEDTSRRTSAANNRQAPQGGSGGSGAHSLWSTVTAGAVEIRNPQDPKQEALDGSADAGTAGTSEYDGASCNGFSFGFTIDGDDLDEDV